MESKPSRIPRRISVQPSSSLSARMMSGSRGSSFSDTYHTRDSSFRLDSEYQSTSASASASSFQPAWYSESELTQGARSRLQNQQRDHDSKRPKLSCTNCTSTSVGRNVGNGLNTVADSSWRHNQVSRSSSMVLGSFGTDLMRERRDLERRTDSSLSNLLDYSHRSGDFTTSSYVQDRVPASYSQGARPKENSVSTLQLNTSSTNHQLPSEHQTLSSSRESSRNSLRSNFSPRSSTQPGFSYMSSRDEIPNMSNSERVGSSQRSFQESSDNEGRRTTRRLLSRIASSMSSTFFSRRSSQDSLNSRSLSSENSYISPRILTTSQSRSNTTSTSEVPDNRASEASQGFRFLRRRWGLSSLSQNHSSEPDSENFNQESEGRNSGPWLSSSFRNRCTPLFSRRRREGRDESSRIPTSDIPSRSHIFRRESNEVVHLEAQSDGAAANRPQASAASSSAATGGFTSDSAQGGRNTGITGILPGSLFRFAVPPALGSNLTDNVMITVDIIPSGWNSTDGKSDKTKNAPSRDPERLQKIKESLLLEDSEEEEGDLCRICQMAAASSSNLLIEPCKCTGSLQYVHQECMKKWLQAKINSGSSLEAVTTCELCKEKLQLNLEDFDIHELHRAHANEQAEYEFISSGLYLVVLLHLCEQSFSDMMGNTNEPSTRVRFINLARTLQAHMEDLESRWNFRSLDLLNLLLQIKPTGQNLSIYFLTKLELCLQA
ncbi:E3 ubiquitin-protein ligase MARCH7 isoform X2 [Tupaia chinensis]|uniref:E3 ubiquitin-protein ligase MARCH7 isoform X2 n=1 Tax=Tupaia chinensis TaxID=246437 RepID=UPI000FFC19A8|nr:E3 ubiquitin-protein ligase MARCH7 isoform X2 [Tupaia chinensis]